MNARLRVCWHIQPQEVVQGAAVWLVWMLHRLACQLCFLCAAGLSQSPSHLRLRTRESRPPICPCRSFPLCPRTSGGGRSLTAGLLPVQHPGALTWRR